MVTVLHRMIVAAVATMFLVSSTALADGSGICGQGSTCDTALCMVRSSPTLSSRVATIPQRGWPHDQVCSWRSRLID